MSFPTERHDALELPENSEDKNTKTALSLLAFETELPHLKLSAGTNAASRPERAAFEGPPSLSLTDASGSYKTRRQSPWLYQLAPEDNQNKKQNQSTPADKAPEKANSRPAEPKTKEVTKPDAQVIDPSAGKSKSNETKDSIEPKKEGANDGVVANLPQLSIADSKKATIPADSSQKKAEPLVQHLPTLDLDESLLKRTGNGTDGTSTVEKKDGASLAYNKDRQLEKITYADGSTRSFRYEGDELVGMISKSGEFIRTRDSKGTLKNEWTMKGQMSGWSGVLKVDQKSGDLFVANTTYKTDLSVEKLRQDGSKEITFANKDLVQISKDGTVSEIKYADGTTRKFSWKENAGAAKDSDKFVLAGVEVQKEGKTYRHKLNESGHWQVQSLENGYWSQAKDETLSLAFDNKSLSYSYKDSNDGIEHIRMPGGIEKELSPDGSKLEYKGGVLSKVIRDDKTREFQWKDSKLISINDGIQGKVWSPNAEGGWQSNKGDLRRGEAVISATGEIEFRKGDSASIIKTDGLEYKRIKSEKENFTVDISRTSVNVKAQDGSQRTFSLDENGEISRESVTRNGKTESWTRGEKLANGNYVWTNEQDKTKSEERKEVKHTDGKLSIEHADGRRYEAETSGKELLANTKEKWQISYKDGMPQESRFPDGTIRKFTFDSKASTPKTIEITSPDGQKTNISKISEGVYNYKWKDGEQKWNVDFTVGRDGSYKYVDKDEKGKTVTRLIDGRTITENPADKSRIEKHGNEITKFEKDGKKLELAYDENKSAIELKDHTSNTIYKKASDGSWTASALDSSRAFKASDNILRKGDLFVDENGTSNFIDKDGRQVRQEAGKAGELISCKERAIEEAQKNSEMSQAEKDRLAAQVLDYAGRSDIKARDKAIFQESLEQFAKRKDLSETEKAETYRQLGRLLESKSDKVFEAKERAELAEQLIWHLANPEKNQQGSNPNCQVTVIRGKMLYEKPSDFAKLITDVVTSGQYKTQDNCTIKMPLSSLKRSNDSEEAKFLAEDGNRTWIGKISDVACANIYWQRQTKTPQGEVVKAGQLVYRHDPPTAGSKDAGARVCKEPGDGYLYPLNNSGGKLITYPSLYARDIADVYKQITGSDETSVLAVKRKDIISGAGVAELSEEGLHKFLSEHKDKTYIAQIYTGSPWVWKDVPRFKPGTTTDDKDEEHVLLINNYDPKTRTVSVDNSWASKYDRLSPERRISLNELWRAMARLDN